MKKKLLLAVLLACGFLSVQAQLTVNFQSHTNPTCFGGANGSILVTVSGGTPPYTYTWSPTPGSGQGTTTASALTAGSYTVTVHDAATGLGSNNISLVNPTPISGTLSSVGVTCNGSTNGQATIGGVTGGTPGYTYSWTPIGGNQNIAMNLPAGSYTCNVKDALGCSPINPLTTTVTQPAPINVTPSQANVSCAGGNNGTAYGSVSGGTPSYSYSWSPNASNLQNVSGLTAGNYTLHVTDSHGCTGTKTYAITQPAALNGNPSSVDETCYGASTGSAGVSPVGGTPGYTYSWSPVAGTNSTLSSLTSGSYTCTITDNNGCVTAPTLFVNQPPQLLGTYASVPVSCNGGNDGSATVTATGGTGAITYSWQPGTSTGPGATGLYSNNYYCYLKDANGCNGMVNVNVSQPGILTANVSSISNISCNGLSEGTAYVSVSGGTAPYTYSWSPSGSTTAGITGLSAGTYTCTVTDSHGCVTTTNGTVTQPAPITIARNTMSTMCGSNTGQSYATPSGGTGPYTYSWSPGGSTAQNIYGQAPGIYTVTVTDTNGCTKSDTANIRNPAGPALTTSSTNVACKGNASGTATVVPTGGTGALTFSWNSVPAQTTATATGLPAGNFTVEVSDANGCKNYASAVITEPATSIAANIGHTDATCHGGTGLAFVTASGGTGSLNYNWIPSGGTTPNSAPVTAGLYTCNIVDGNGCTYTQTTTVGEPAAITVTPNQVNNLCNGGATGSITLLAAGGTGGFNYSWNTGQTTSTISSLSAGGYTCTVIDGNGCTSAQIISITQPTSLMITPSQTNIGCHGQMTGSALVNLVGGTSPYTYSWTPAPSLGQGTNHAANIAAGTYSCLVNDHNGCTSNQTFSITQPAAIAATANFTNATCIGLCNGTATAIASGGTGAYTYSWGPGGAVASNITGLCAGSYSCAVTDANGCSTSTNTGVVSQPPSPLTVTTSQVNENCNGATTGSITVTASGGGGGALTYSWSPAGGTGNVANNLPAGTYTCSVADGGGCTASAHATLTEPLALILNLVSTGASCGNACDGSINATTTGGTGAFTYSWSTAGQAGGNATALCPGTYTCMVTDANGCQTTVPSSVSTHASPAITGTVTGNVSGVINAGWAYLVQYDTVLHRQQVVDSTNVLSGRYHFNSSVGGNFLVYIIADKLAYPHAVKTYFANTDQWVNATVLHAGCATADTANVQVIELAPTSGGGSMSGTVLQDVGFTARLTGNGPVPIVLSPGDPVPGLDVNLEQHPGGIIAQQTTDNNGYYHFVSVPTGTFEVFVDVPGLGMVSQYTRTVTSNQNFSNLNYRIDSTHIHPDSTLITGIVTLNGSSLENSVHVAPNPFKDQLNITYSLSESSEVVIELYNTLGEQVVGVKLPHQDAGTYTYPLDARNNNLSQGIYMMRVTLSGKLYTRRVVSVH